MKNHPLLRKSLEHVLVLLAFAALTLGLTWPMARHYFTHLTGIGDVRQQVWQLWHARLALQGQEPFLFTNLLYFPHGATLITIPIYPLIGLLTYPFWSLGIPAAYNTTLLITFTLSGWFIYLLGRSLRLDRLASIYAGVLVVAAPIHMVAPITHMTKAFIGGMALALLALNLTLELKRSRWWGVLTALAVLVTLLGSPEQFVFLALALIFFPISAFLRSRGGDRWEIAKRTILMAMLTVLMVSWYIRLAAQVSNDQTIEADASGQAVNFQPDLIEFLLPPEFTYSGSLVGAFTLQYSTYPLETAVFLGWTAILLCGLAFLKGGTRAREWVLFSLLCILFALGPDLKILKEHYLRLPYALFAYLPGLQALRTPGRIMLLGYFGIGISAAFGLTWLKSRLGIWSYRGLALAAIALIAIEFWPYPMPQSPVPAPPQFYRDISKDRQTYGVFDLPIRPVQEIKYESAYFIYSSYYQLDQITHNKGIASGYIGRQYTRHPVFPALVTNSSYSSVLIPEIRVDGQPVNRFANARYELARNNYRYVVFHKPQPDNPDYPPGSWGEAQAQLFIDNVFGNQAPLVDDALSTVYTVGPLTGTAGISTTVLLPAPALYDSWMEFATGETAYHSPAMFYLGVARPAQARLGLELASIKNCEGGIIEHGYVRLQSGQQQVTRPIAAGKPQWLPLQLFPGSHELQLDFLANKKELRGVSETSCILAVFKWIELQTSPQPGQGSSAP